jgi:hypothetical protein
MEETQGKDQWSATCVVVQRDDGGPVWSLVLCVSLLVF